ncbi:MAG: FtsX-like permease family protein, partial [Chitinophagaceae bacterium]|nr:FtsX-like permease family protein [Chitinophagaceae bacterium]
FHGTPGPLADEIKKVLPEVTYAASQTWDDKVAFSAGDRILKQEGLIAGADFFQLFSFPLVQGKPETALNTPVSIAISRKMAVGLFGSAEKAFGQTVRYQDSKDLKVTAVYEDITDQSSLKGDYILNWETYLETNGWAREWGNNGPRTYILLKPGTDPIKFESKIEKFLDNYNKEQSKSFYIELGVQRFSDIYLHNIFKNGKLSGGRIDYVKLFSIVAIFILVIACINFMNLTTARSIKRSREIGIRKVIGAVRNSLVKQFLGEALLLTFFALGIALVLTAIILPVFNNITTKSIEFPANISSFWITIIALAIATGLLAGSYPALFLSAFQPIKVLKGQMKFGKGATWFRKGLVVFQFVLSTVLIVGTIVVSRQIDYIQSKDIGYTKENLIYIPIEGEYEEKYDLFKNEALSLPGVKNVSRISQSPTSIENGTGGVEWEGKDPNVTPMFTQASVGYDFIKTMDLRLLAGRDYSKDFALDSVSYLVNESAAAKMNYKDPVGKPLTFWGKKGRIIGLMKDFHLTSLHTPIQPLIIRLAGNEQYGTILVRTQPGKTRLALEGLQKLGRRLNPQFPFTYDFSDEEYKKLYLTEQTVNSLSGYFAFLAIFISCLGLLGLTIFTAEQRVREMGIRKVLGASFKTIFGLLSVEFLVLVSVAMLIAFPLSWWIMQNWLQNFTYRTNINAWVFIIAAAVSLIIAFSTISVHAIKAALTNPVKSLRTE